VWDQNSEFLEEWQMKLHMSERELPPTFYSSSELGRNTRIDHIAVPLSLNYGLSVRPHVWMKSCRKLQLIRTQHSVDQVPIAISFPSHIYAAMPAPRIKADRDAIVMCLLYGKQRNKFIEVVEQMTHESTDNIRSARELKSPTAIYAIISQILHDSMCQAFPAKSADPCGLKKQRDALLRERKQIRLDTWIAHHDPTPATAPCVLPAETATCARVTSGSFAMRQVQSLAAHPAMHCTACTHPRLNKNVRMQSSRG
jgi:hypothetical protein